MGTMLWIRTTGLLLQTVGATQKVVGPAACRRYALFDPATYEVTDIVDCECVGTRPRWEDAYSVFVRPLN